MIVYRLAIEMYKDDLTGNGAKLFGGRWNSAGIPVLYTTENISLAVLEILVRTEISLIPLHYFILKLDIPDSIEVNSITTQKLKKDWREDAGYTRFMGDEFAKVNQCLILKVPSAIVSEEHNFIINPKHAEFRKMKISWSKKFQFDKRLFLKNE